MIKTYGGEKKFHLGREEIVNGFLSAVVKGMIQKTYVLSRAPAAEFLECGKDPLMGVWPIAVVVASNPKEAAEILGGELTKTDFYGFVGEVVFSFEKIKVDREKWNGGFSDNTIKCFTKKGNPTYEVCFYRDGKPRYRHLLQEVSSVQ